MHIYMRVFSQWHLYATLLYKNKVVLRRLNACFNVISIGHISGVMLS